MKTTLLCFFVILLKLNSFSQSIFQTAYGNNDIEKIISIVRDSNYYYVVAQCTTISSFDKDISFFCIDNDGGLLWSVILGTNKNDYAKSLIKTSDGSFAISGETFGGFIDSTTSDLFLIKTDDQGFPILAETYGGPGNETGGALIEDLNGNFYLSGTTSSYGNAFESAFIIKTDPMGNQLWTNVNSSMESNWLTELLQKPNGDLLAAGFCYNTSNTVYKNYVVSFDHTNGNLLQAKHSGNSNDCVIAGMTLTSDGGYATCGLEFFDMGTFNMNVCKYDSAGNRLWNNIYGTNQDDAYSITEADNGDLIVSGKTNVGTVVSPNYKSTLLRLDSTGNIIWAKTYGYSATTSESNIVINGMDNSIVSAGRIHEPGLGSNAHIIKTDATGNSGCFENSYSPASSILSFNDSIGADWQLVNMTQFSINPFWQSLANQFTLYCFGTELAEVTDNSSMIFPNPGTGIFRIETESAGEHHVEIFDAVGQKIIDEVFYQNHIDVNLKNYSAGLYYFKIDNANSRKVILTGN
jgi:Secretion system C-terminal sorting domain